ncbi:hypothetical protein ACFLQU_00935 [Verrucomicrobiota bacterium]
MLRLLISRCTGWLQALRRRIFSTSSVQETNIKDLIDRSDLSPIQLAKCIKSLKSTTQSPAEFEAIRNQLLPTEKREETDSILYGLEQEDEFSILCRLMGTCESLLHLEQTPFLEERQEIPPDFVATFSPGCSVLGKSKNDLELSYKCFVEVKSTKETVFKISKRNLQRRQNFANRYALPLMFAVRFTRLKGSALWLLMDADSLQERNRRIAIDDFIESQRHVIFDDYFIMPLPHLHLARYYDSRSKKGGVYHKEYGDQVRSCLLLKEQWVEIHKDDAFFCNALLDTFDPHEVRIEKRENLTCQVLNIGIQSRSLMDIIYRMNSLPVDKSESRIYDPTRIVSRFDTNSGQKLIDRQLVESFLQSYKRVFFLASFGEPEEQLAKLRALCGK